MSKDKNPPQPTGEADEFSAATRELLEQQKQLFEDVVQEQNELVCRFTPDTTITFANDAYCRYYGRSREDLLGKRFIDLVPEDEREHVLLSLGELLPGKTNVHERRDITRDGRVVWLHWHRTALSEADDRITEIQAVGRDISDVKFPQEAVIAEKVKFQAIIDDQAEPIVRFTPDGERTFVNAAYCALRGRSREELVGGSIYSWHSDNFSGELKAVLDTIRPGESHLFEIFDTSGSEEGCWMQWNTRAFGDPNGEVSEYQAVGRDVTAAHRRGAVLESLNWFASNPEASQGDVLGSILDFGCAHFGLESGLVVEVRDRDCQIAYSAGASNLIQSGVAFDRDATGCGRVLDSGAPLAFGAVETSRDDFLPSFGVEPAATFIGAPLYMEDQPFGVLAFTARGEARRALGADDLEMLGLMARWVETRIASHRAYDALEQEVQRRTVAEQSLSKQVMSLQEVNEELARFAFVASHDLQEPLRQIESATSVMLEDYADLMDEEGAQFLNIAASGASRARGLITDLLKFARIGTANMQYEHCSLAKLVKEAQENLARQISEAGATITVGELPDLECEPVLVRQLFQNLISNSIKFRGEAAPSVTVDAEHRDGRWIIGVSDNGIGIDPQYAERVLEVFQRLHGKQDYPGTGIGLAICRRIVERHGGTLWLDTEYSGGSRFCFNLPEKAPDTSGEAD